MAAVNYQRRNNQHDVETVELVQGRGKFVSLRLVLMEKKSAAATNAKVSKYIPEYIAFFNTTSCIGDQELSVIILSSFVKCLVMLIFIVCPLANTNVCKYSDWMNRLLCRESQKQNNVVNNNDMWWYTFSVNFVPLN
jgi:hypothetical protein